MVDQAEGVLHALGLREIRVRYHKGDLARLEVPLDALPRLAEPAVRGQLVEQLKRFGFKYVTLDLEGFRSGSLNAILPVESLHVLRWGPQLASSSTLHSFPSLSLAMQRRAKAHSCRECLPELASRNCRFIDNVLSICPNPTCPQQVPVRRSTRCVWSDLALRLCCALVVIALCGCTAVRLRTRTVKRLARCRICSISKCSTTWPCLLVLRIRSRGMFA